MAETFTEVTGTKARCEPGQSFFAWRAALVERFAVWAEQQCAPRRCGQGQGQGGMSH